MNQRSRKRNKERNKYAKLKNLVMKTVNGIDPINIPNCNASCIETFDHFYWKKDQSTQIEKLAKLKQQRIERGFDDTELWNLYNTIAKYTLPRLVEFRKVVNGYPPSFETFDDWLDAIDKMIYAFDHIVNKEKYDEELEKSLGITWDGYYTEKKLPDGNYEIVHGVNYNKELMNQYHKIEQEEVNRINIGLELFGNYFMNLWW